MRDHLLLMANNLEEYLGSLEARFTIHRWDLVEDRDALMRDVGDKIRVVGTNGHVGCSATMMDRLPNLELIGCFGVGYDAIDVEAARQRRIAITNTPDVLSDAVAELALGLMIALARQIPQSDRYMRDGRWHKGDYPLTSELSGKTAGIVGLGRIGKELARRLQVMKMRVVYHGRSEQPHQPYDFYSDIRSMASDVDWLVLCLPGNSDSHNIVSADVLAALGDRGCLVNIARGSVVDEEALCRAIVDGTIGGAALDVFANEPSIPSALLDADNVVLSPHASSGTTKTRRAMGELVIDNICAHLDGRPLLTRVV